LNPGVPVGSVKDVPLSLLLSGKSFMLSFPAIKGFPDSEGKSKSLDPSFQQKKLQPPFAAADRWKGCFRQNRPFFVFLSKILCAGRPDQRTGFFYRQVQPPEQQEGFFFAETKALAREPLICRENFFGKSENSFSSSSSEKLKTLSRSTETEMKPASASILL
jgi:hypothetical protein